MLGCDRREVEVEAFDAVVLLVEFLNQTRRSLQRICRNVRYLTLLSFHGVELLRLIGSVQLIFVITNDPTGPSCISSLVPAFDLLHEPLRVPDCVKQGFVMVFVRKMLNNGLRTSLNEDKSPPSRRTWLALPKVLPLEHPGSSKISLCVFGVFGKCGHYVFWVGGCIGGCGARVVLGLVMGV